MTLKIHDTLSRIRREFQPIQEGRVGMYVCGVTVYDLCHIGHARCYVVFDVIVRYLRHLGYQVKYVRNFTDVDDKIIRRAAEQGVTCEELTGRYIEAFHQDMDALGVLRADVEPRVTEHIQDIIAFIQKILDNGHAYQVGGDVYFSIDSFPDYGKLSQRDLDKLVAGASGRVDGKALVRNPLDFALWKASKPGEPSWPSPWGPGRPGWHIECSTMSARHLGPTFDIHGGGQDLVFPHHENEIAQSEAAHGTDMARFWAHNGFVNCPVYVYFTDPEDDSKRYSHREVNSVESQFFHKTTGQRLKPVIVERSAVRFQDEDGTRTAWHRDFDDLELKLEHKMSKSLGNFYTIREILQDWHPEALRYFLLTVQYRAPLNFSREALAEATSRIEYLYETLARVRRLVSQMKPRPSDTPLQPQRLQRIAATFSEGMDDDFNTPKALSALADALRFANEIADRKGKAGKRTTLEAILTTMEPMLSVLGIGNADPARVLDEIRDLKLRSLDISKSEIERLVAERTEARKSRDYARSDAIRDQLLQKGIMLMDTPGGTRWKVG